MGISLLDTILDKRDVEADKLQLVGFKLLQGVFLTGAPLKLTSMEKSLSISTGAPLKFTSMEKS